ncbi:hypothetical protein P7C71_g5306, partial [Lecanoromycetidae sp. Uapishka_2]
MLERASIDGDDDGVGNERKGSGDSGGRGDDYDDSESLQHDDEVDGEVGGGGVRLPTNMVPSKSSTSTALNRSNPGQGSPLNFQQYGLKIAKQREQVRQAARRGVAFGFEVHADDEKEGGGGRRRRGGESMEKRKHLEAVQYGRVVEASFAKGDWGVRWRQ